MKSKVVSLLVVSLLVGVVLTVSVPVFAKKPDRGYLYYQDEVVRTFVPNGKLLQKEGTDPLYAFPPDGDYTGQFSVIEYAPGDKEYTGGHWAVWVVTWDDPDAAYLITNTDDLWAAVLAGDLTIARHTELDVLCPVLPGSMWNPAA